MVQSIETSRIILREWQEEDFSHFARVNADPLVMEYMPRVLPPEDSDKLVRRFQRHFKKHGYGMYALETKADESFVGFVGLNHVEFDAHFTPSVEIAWRLDYGFWGQGYATEAALRVLDHGFNALSLDKIVSFTVHDNARSIHVMEKIGLQHDKNGDFDYPSLKSGHPLGRFVLYKMDKKQYKAGA